MKKHLFIFDMGFVVVTDCGVWAEVLKAVGINSESAGERFRGLFQAAERGNITGMESLILLSRRLGQPVPKENYWETKFHPVLCAPTVRLINNLKAAGQRVICGTNTMDVHYQYHIKHNEYSMFDAVYASHIMGQVKPDITFWHYIKNAEKEFAFDDMVFFDDMKQNVDAASALGIHAHVFTDAPDAAIYIESVCGFSLPAQ